MREKSDTNREYMCLICRLREKERERERDMKIMDAADLLQMHEMIFTDLHYTCQCVLICVCVAVKERKENLPDDTGSR